MSFQIFICLFQSVPPRWGYPLWIPRCLSRQRVIHGETSLKWQHKATQYWLFWVFCFFAPKTGLWNYTIKFISKGIHISNEGNWLIVWLLSIYPSWLTTFSPSFSIHLLKSYFPSHMVVSMTPVCIYCASRGSPPWVLSQSCRRCVFEGSSNFSSPFLTLPRSFPLELFHLLVRPLDEQSIECWL